MRLLSLLIYLFSFPVFAGGIGEDIAHLKTEIIARENSTIDLHLVNLFSRAIHKNILMTFVDPKSPENIRTRGEQLAASIKDYYQLARTIIANHEPTPVDSSEQFATKLNSLKQEKASLESKTNKVADQIDGLKTYVKGLILLLNDQKNTLTKLSKDLQDPSAQILVDEVKRNLDFWRQYCEKFDQDLQSVSNNFSQVSSYIFISLPKSLEAKRLGVTVERLEEVRDQINDIFTADQLYIDAKMLILSYQKDQNLFKAKVTYYDYLKAMGIMSEYITKITDIYNRLNKLLATTDIAFANVAFEVKTIYENISSEFNKLKSAGWQGMQQRRVFAVNTVLTKRIFATEECLGRYQKFLDDNALVKEFDDYEKQSDKFVYLRDFCMTMKAK